MTLREPSRNRWVIATSVIAVMLASCSPTASVVAPTAAPVASPVATPAPDVTRAPSPAPAVTPAPVPAPSDGGRSPAPSPTLHSDPELEALLPDTLDGRAVTKESQTGVDMGATDANPMLVAFGKHPADLAAASGTAEATASQGEVSIGVQRLRGVQAKDVLASQLRQITGAKVTMVKMAGHDVTYLEGGPWPVWYYPAGELLWAVGLTDEATATRFIASLP